ncbi:MAG: hypothetical protein JJU45_08105 [Acidimicrobiia bacterium]|nr:hypothetical protein [Acidimicrobiia bacterium]
MNDRLFVLTIPVQEWEPQHYVPASASEAVALGDQLTRSTTTVNLLWGHRAEIPVAPEGFEVTASLRWRQEPYSFSTSAEVVVVAMDTHRRPHCAVEVQVATTWRSGSRLEILPDAGETFCLAFGALEPIDQAARSIEAIFLQLGFEVLVTPGPSLGDSRNAALHTSQQPPMSSDAASPLNPYALAGIPGHDAEIWANAAYSATEAAPWATAGLDAEVALSWIGEGIPVDEAVAWNSAGYGATPLDPGSVKDFRQTRQRTGAESTSYLTRPGSGLKPGSTSRPQQRLVTTHGSPPAN